MLVCEKPDCRSEEQKANDEAFERDLKERMAAAWDDAPADADDEIDIAAWVAEYRVRLHKTKLEGRNRSRDKGLLQTFAFLMEEAGKRVFDADRRALSEHSGLFPDAVTAGIRSLRAAGLLRCICFVGFNEQRCHIHRYALVMDALEPVEDVASEALPDTKIEALKTGDFSNDAFAGHKGMKGNRRAIYVWLLENPNSTIYEVHKGVGVAYNTAKTAIQWLKDQHLVSQTQDGKVRARNPINGDDALHIIVVNNFLNGKTENRLEYCERDWFQIRMLRHWERMKTRVTKKANLDFDGNYSTAE